MWTEYDLICLSHIDMRNIRKLSQTKYDKKLVNVTRIILVEITESHDFVGFTNYLWYLLPKYLRLISYCEESFINYKF